MVDSVDGMARKAPALSVYRAHFLASPARLPPPSPHAHARRIHQRMPAAAASSSAALRLRV